MSKSLNCLLALVSLLLALLLSELLLARYIDQKTVFSPELQLFEQSRGTLYEADEKLGYKLKLDTYKNSAFGTQNGALYRELAKTQQLSTNKILIIGDSITEDMLLNRALVNLQIEDTFFFNIGTPGYNTLQEFYYFKDFVKIKPDTLIVQFCFNDFLPSYTIGKTSTGTRFKEQSKENLAVKFPWLFKNSAIYRLIYALLYKDEINSVDYDIVSRGIKEFKAYTRDQSINLIFVIYPYLGDRPDEYNSLYSFIRNELQAQNVNFVDLHPAFEKCDLRALRRAPLDNIHPNFHSHSIAASVIHNYLLENKIIKNRKIANIDCPKRPIRAE